MTPKVLTILTRLKHGRCSQLKKVGSLSGVQMRIYAMVPGELAGPGLLEGMVGIWHVSCAVLLAGRRSWSNCCRIRQHRATTVPMNFGNGRGRLDTSAWWSTSKLPHRITVGPVTIACIIRGHGSVSDVLQCADFEVEENTWMKTRLVVQRPAVKLQGHS